MRRTSEPESRVSERVCRSCAAGGFFQLSVHGNFSGTSSLCEIQISRGPACDRSLVYHLRMPTDPTLLSAVHGRVCNTLIHSRSKLLRVLSTVVFTRVCTIELAHARIRAHGARWRQWYLRQRYIPSVRSKVIPERHRSHKLLKTDPYGVYQVNPILAQECNNTLNASEKSTFAI